MSPTSYQLLHPAIYSNAPLRLAGTKIHNLYSFTNKNYYFLLPLVNTHILYIKKYMIKFIQASVIVLFFTIGMSSCTDNTKKTASETNTAEDLSVSENYEAFISKIDANDSLGIANTLYYTNQKGDAVEVELLLNSKDEIVKLTEIMTSSHSNSIVSNEFYYKNGKLYVSKEFREQSKNDSLYFVEYRSYYDTSETILLTKKRTAQYEELLDQEPFTNTEKRPLSDDRAKRVINQKGEFETTFQGFVEVAEYLYIVVGENKKSGYSSSLVVQSYTPLIKELKANQSAMLGTPLEISFGRTNDDGVVQILFNVQRKEAK